MTDGLEFQLKSLEIGSPILSPQWETKNESVNWMQKIRLALGLQIQFLELPGKKFEHLRRREGVELLILPLQVFYLMGSELMRGWKQSHLCKQ